MRIECFEPLRSSVNPVHIDMHEIKFMPNPWLKEGEYGTTIADVADETAIDALLGNPKKNIRPRGNFRPYDPDRTYKELTKRRMELERKKGKFAGYYLDKVIIAGQDRGYMIVDGRGDFPRYCGRDGKYTQNLGEVQPFGSLGAAETWLIASVKDKDVPQEAERKKWTCGECPASFDSMEELVGHWGDDHRKKTGAPETQTESTGETSPPGNEPAAPAGDKKGKPRG